MSPRWHQLVETDDGFVDTAPLRYVNTVEVPVPPDEAWSALTADDALVSWSPLVTRLRWATPRPFGVGTTRTVTVLGFLTTIERYYRWEQGRRKTFDVVQANFPGLRRLAEDHLVEQTSAGSRFTWTVAVEPHPALTPLLRIASPVTSLVLRRIANGLRSQVGRQLPSRRRR